MTTVRDILSEVDRFAPWSLAFPWDNVGLQVGDPNGRVTKAVVSLDRSLAATRFAIEMGAQLLVSHHPLLFERVGTVDSTTHVGRTIHEAIRAGLSIVTAHTNWDNASPGLNDALAAELELAEVKTFGTSPEEALFKLVVFVPSDNADSVVDALAGAGAGRIGNYRRCAFLTSGEGTFEPLDGANPTIGTVGEREVVPEVRVEIVVPSDKIDAAICALKECHPYEEPAFDLLAMKAAARSGAGRIGILPRPMTLGDLAEFAHSKLGQPTWKWGDPKRTIKSLAVVGGAADGEWRAARSAGADAFLTGEVKQHVGIEASESGVSILAAGHFATEQPGVRLLARTLEAHLPSIEWHVYEP